MPAGLRIKVDHHATHVARRDAQSRPWLAVAEHQPPAYPSVFVKQLGIVPLAFGAAWKVIDLLVEYGLAAAGLAPGRGTRWTITEISPDSFHWLGEALQPNGKSWTLEGEFRAKRTG